MRSGRLQPAAGGEGAGPRSRRATCPSPRRASLSCRQSSGSSGRGSKRLPGIAVSIAPLSRVINAGASASLDRSTSQIGAARARAGAPHRDTASRTSAGELSATDPSVPVGRCVLLNALRPTGGRFVGRTAGCRTGSCRTRRRARDRAPRTQLLRRGRAPRAASTTSSACSSRDQRSVSPVRHVFQRELRSRASRPCGGRGGRSTTNLRRRVRRFALQVGAALVGEPAGRIGKPPRLDAPVDGRRARFLLEEPRDVRLRLPGTRRRSPAGKWP